MAFSLKADLDVDIQVDLADNFTEAITAQHVREIVQAVSDSFVHMARPKALTDAANIDWDLDEGLTAGVTLGGNRTLNEPTNARAGQRITIQVIQDGTGNRLLTWDAFFVFENDTAPTLSTGTNRMDVFSFVVVDNGNGALKAAAESEMIGVYTATGGGGGGPWVPGPD